MRNLEYNGYTGSIEYSKEDQLFFGKVLGIKSLILYEGSTGPELEHDFRGAIEDYINTCNTMKTEPEKPFKGSFNVRISSRLHQQAALLAMNAKVSLNNFVAESIRERIIRISQENI